jgi:GTPase SAR1 family protein
LEDFSDKNRYLYLEVSAKTGSNIQSLFRKICEKLIEKKMGVKK